MRNRAGTPNIRAGEEAEVRQVRSSQFKLGPCSQSQSPQAVVLQPARFACCSYAAADLSSAAATVRVLHLPERHSTMAASGLSLWLPKRSSICLEQLSHNSLRTLANSSGMDVTCAERKDLIDCIRTSFHNTSNALQSQTWELEWSFEVAKVLQCPRAFKQTSRHSLSPGSASAWSAGVCSVLHFGLVGVARLSAVYGGRDKIGCAGLQSAGPQM